MHQPPPVDIGEGIAYFPKGFTCIWNNVDILKIDERGLETALECLLVNSHTSHIQ